MKVSYGKSLLSFQKRPWKDFLIMSIFGNVGDPAMKFKLVLKPFWSFFCFSRTTFLTMILGIFNKSFEQTLSSKSDSHLPKKICFMYFIESPLKMMKNAFYFILKALFFLKIFKLLSWLFCYIEYMTWLER